MNSPARDSIVPAKGDASRVTRHEIVRYTPGTRINHWIVAISFVLLALTGLSMFDPLLFWLSDVFGGGAVTRVIHPWIGLVMSVAFLLLALRVWRENVMRRRDWVWIRRIREVVGNDEADAPDVGRNNGGQKLVFLVALLCLTILLLSGLAIWRAYFAAYFPIGFTRLATLLHALFAFVLIVTIVVHIYAGIWVKGSIRAMTRGTVSYGWAWKHHRLWFREVTKNEPHD
jgi:formate dehydrogenase subunit gamma